MFITILLEIFTAFLYVTIFFFILYSKYYNEYCGYFFTFKFRINIDNLLKIFAIKWNFVVGEKSSDSVSMCKVRGEARWNLMDDFITILLKILLIFFILQTL